MRRVVPATLSTELSFRWSYTLHCTNDSARGFNHAGTGYASSMLLNWLLHSCLYAWAAALLLQADTRHDFELMVLEGCEYGPHEQHSDLLRGTTTIKQPALKRPCS
jgi:hypothetical protein